MKLWIEGLDKSYEKVKVLEQLDFHFESGKIYGLLGRNGAGKTTFFNCLNGDIKANAGRMYVEEDGLEKPLKTEDIGYVLSTPVVPDFLTAKEFLKFFLDVNKDKITDMKSMDEYFKMVMIEEKDRNKLLKDYSHGMKNKMQMLINMIANPKIILLDEPLTSFDVVVAEEMKNLLRSMKRDCIIIFSTHILELSLDLCDEIVLLHEGKLELIENDLENNKETKNRIIQALRGEEHD